MMKLERLRHIWRVLKRYPHVVDRKEKCRELGSVYGGFGVAEDWLKEDMVVFSFGVGEDISFDKELQEKYHAHIFAFDPTPKVSEWVKQISVEGELFTFYPLGLSDKCESVPFFLPDNENYISGSIVKHKDVSTTSVQVKMMDFCSIYDLTGIEGEIDLLKMDIEGAEFSVIPNLLSCFQERDIHIRQICLEWHGRFFSDGRKKVKECVKLLRKKGYEVVYISEDGLTNAYVQKR